MKAAIMTGMILGVLVAAARTGWIGAVLLGGAVWALHVWLD